MVDDNDMPDVLTEPLETVDSDLNKETEKKA